jgi:DNA modification methylase
MKGAEKIEVIGIEKLIPYAKNSRTHSDEQVAQIAASIKEFGFNNPVLIDKYDVIIAGHGRVMAARKCGLMEVPCIRLGHLTETQRKAYVIADNRLALNAGWDNELLTIELNELLADDFALDILGFNPDELKALLDPVTPTEGLTDEDAVPEVPEEPKTKPGDIYRLGRHRLMCGDSTSIDAVEKLMDGYQADLLNTDPPYNVDYDNSSRPKPGKALGKIQNDTMDNESFYEFLRSAFTCAYTVLKDGSSAYVWHADRETINFKKAALDSGFEFAQTIIWKKPMLLSRTRYQWAHEPCLFFVKGSPYFTDDRKKTTVWDFGGYDKSKNVHPTQKPVFIPEEAINNSSKQGSNVLDLFGGSGSTMIACEKLGRTNFTMELDPKYCDVIVKRWEDFTGQKAELVI